MSHTSVCLCPFILNQYLAHPRGTRWNSNWQSVQRYRNLSYIMVSITVCKYFWGHAGWMSFSALVFMSRFGGWQSKRANKKKTNQPVDRKAVRVQRLQAIMENTMTHYFKYLPSPWTSTAFVLIQTRNSLWLFLKRKKASGKSFTAFLITFFFFLQTNFLFLLFGMTGLPSCQVLWLIHFSKLKDRWASFWPLTESW